MKSRKPDPRAQARGPKPEGRRQKPKAQETPGKRDKDGRKGRPLGAPSGAPQAREGKEAKEAKEGRESRERGRFRPKDARKERNRHLERAARPAQGTRPSEGTAQTNRPRDERAPFEARQPKREPRPQPDSTGPRRSGTVALVGRPNVGKSTLLNAALEQPLAITSKTPQTTRDELLGVVHHGSAEIALLDTPGLHRPRTQLGRVMNEAARDAARRADVVVFVTDVSPRAGRPKEDENGEMRETIRPLLPHPGDLVLLQDLTKDTPSVLVVNKVDLVRDKKALLPLLEAYGRQHSFDAIVPVSARREDGVVRVLDEIARLLPEGPFRYEADDVTDKPTRFFVAEYVREQILRATEEEVPHATAVTVDRYAEPSAPGRAVQIDATIHVERPGQKKILIGAAGAMMKRIGIAARQRIEELVGGKVVLRLWVRVTPDWRESLPRLEELGYGKSRAKSADENSAAVLFATKEEDESLDHEAAEEDADENEEEGEDADDEDTDDEDATDDDSDEDELDDEDDEALDEEDEEER